MVSRAPRVHGVLGHEQHGGHAHTNFYFLNNPYGNIITSTFTALLGEKYYILGFLPATALALFLMYLPWAADYKKKKRA